MNVDECDDRENEEERKDLEEKITLSLSQYIIQYPKLWKKNVNKKRKRNATRDILTIFLFAFFFFFGFQWIRVQLM